jgi:hypothetical protein
MDALTLVFYGIFGLVVIIGIFIRLRGYKIRDELLEIERHNTPIYSENCGGCLDCKHILKRSPLYSPDVRLTIYNEFIVISCASVGKDEKIFGKRVFLFKYEEIDKIELGKKFFMTPQALNIHYHKYGALDYIAIFPKDWKRVKEIIESKMLRK